MSHRNVSASLRNGSLFIRWQATRNLKETQFVPRLSLKTYLKANGVSFRNFFSTPFPFNARLFCGFCQAHSNRRAATLHGNPWIMQTISLKTFLSNWLYRSHNIPGSPILSLFRSTRLTAAVVLINSSIWVDRVANIAPILKFLMLMGRNLSTLLTLYCFSWLLLIKQ